MSAEERRQLRAGFRAGIPYALAALLLGISFGVIAEPVLGALASVVMSVAVFAGSAQFAAVAVLADGGSTLAAVVAGALLNARYGPMGVALAPSLRGPALERASYALAMVDASWAMASRGGGRFEPSFMLGATLPSIPAWIGGTAIGALAGDVIGDPETFGLDAIFPAFFLALLVPELRHPGGRAAALAGATIALALTPVAPPGVPIVAASAAALLGLTSRDRANENEPDS